ncbi:MAG: metalloregulator ArsR/SmtB family transcription factor [Anaerolineae bacterium]
MDAAYESLATLGQAMAHPTRLRILDALARQEACVCHLTALLDQRQAHVSQHLRILKDAGLVNDRRDGQMVYYSLADSRTAAVISLLKDLSRAMAPELSFREPGGSPLHGCPCPRCTAASSGCCDSSDHDLEAHG